MKKFRQILRAFLGHLVRDMGDFMKEEIAIAVLLFAGTLLYQIVHRHISVQDLKENTLEALVPYIWIICLFGVYHVVRTALRLGQEFESKTDKGSMRTVLCISAFLIIFFVSVSAVCGWMAYRTGTVPQPSDSELAEFGFGATVDVVVRRYLPPSTTYLEPIATGLLVSHKAGYVVTCSGGITTEWAERNLSVGFAGPPRLSGEASVASAAMFVQAQVVQRDEDIGLALLALDGNPFNPNSLVMKPGFKLSVPHLASEIAKDGERVVKIVFESEPSLSEVPNIRSTPTEAIVEFGHISRSGLGLNLSVKPVRLYSNLPFRPADCGAPIFDNTKAVIGLIQGIESGSGSGGETAIIPSAYVIDFLKKCNLEPE